MQVVHALLLSRALYLSTALLGLLSQVGFLLLLSANVQNAAALDMTSYLPLTAGNLWSYRNNSGATQTSTMSSAVVLPSGVSAFPLRTVQSNRAGYAQAYYTNDSDGLREHQEFVSSIYVSGYGNVSGSVTLLPAAIYSPVNPVVGGNYTSAGTATMTFTNLGSFALNYTSNTQVIGFEQVTNYSGTQSWLAAKVARSITISGTINGQFLSINTTNTSWLADGVGIVKNLSPNSSGVMETWQLTSTNVVPPVPSNPLLHPYVFDPVIYLGANPDLQQAFGSNPEEAQNHWINSGISEGRIASPAFSVNWYKYQNSDLSVFGRNNELYVQHYVQNGIREGRGSAVNFSVKDYLSFNLDLASAFGTNYSAATSHYISNGMREGRRSSQYFDPKQYLANNRDLAAGFGSTNYTAATMHYMSYGVSEGRVVAPSYPIVPRTFVVLPVPTNPADCLFNWAERTYPTLFAPAGAVSNTLVPYYYRNYSQTNADLRVSSADNHVYYLGPSSSNAILDVGALSTWLATAGCQ